jgi:hypothetical protein
MGYTRLYALLLLATTALSISCDQPNQLGNNCGSVTLSPTNVNNSSVLAQVVTHVTTQITMPNGTITTIINTINNVGNSSDRIIILQSSENSSSVHNIYTNVLVQSDNSPLVALVIVIIALAILKELMPCLKNKYCAQRQLAPAAKVDPVDMTAIRIATEFPPAEQGQGR